MVVIEAEMGSRMLKFSRFEAEMQLRYPDHQVVIRNIADEGDTPLFRPHPGRELQVAFAGAPKHKTGQSGRWTKGAVGFLEKPDQWLTRLKADMILAFFGYHSEMQGEAVI